MPRYRKKPVEIEAMQFLGDYESVTAIHKWAGKTLLVWFMHSNKMNIPTLEGDMTANVGDWIIRGINGEYYPCKPDIFEKTYEPVEGGE